MNTLDESVFRSVFAFSEVKAVLHHPGGNRTTVFYFLILTFDLLSPAFRLTAKSKHSRICHVDEGDIFGLHQCDLINV
jgi:hypothetical protein